MLLLRNTCILSCQNYLLGWKRLFVQFFNLRISVRLKDRGRGYQCVSIMTLPYQQRLWINLCSLDPGHLTFLFFIFYLIYFFGGKNVIRRQKKHGNYLACRLNETCSIMNMVCDLTSQSTAMVMSRRSVNPITTFFLGEVRSWPKHFLKMLHDRSPWKYGTQVWGQAGIEPTTPGSAIGQ